MCTVVTLPRLTLLELIRLTTPLAVIPELALSEPRVIIFPPVTFPFTLKPLTLEKTAIVLGVIAPGAVVSTCTLVARLVSVKFSAATTPTRPVDTLPN